MSTEVLVPPLGQTVDTVILITWYRSEGEFVTEGEPLFAIETDKAALDVEAPASGVLRQVSAKPNDEVDVLTPIALIAALDEVLENPQSSTVSEPTPALNQTGTDKWNRKDDSRVFISPRAKRLTDEHNIQLTALQATGPEGAIIERDVQMYLNSLPEATPIPHKTAAEANLDSQKLTSTLTDRKTVKADGKHTTKETKTVSIATEVNEAVEIIPLRGIRAIIAKRMLESTNTTAPVTLMSETDATMLVELRQHLSEDGVKVSYNDLLLCVLARALRDHPQLNSSLDGEVIKIWQRIHIGLAIDTDKGLLVPVMRDVDRKRLSEIAEETQSFIERAKAGQCIPEELTGGTFTLTNLGMYGIDTFTPIIKLPECAILGVGRIKTRPVVIEDKIVARQTVWLSLTFDHRLVDGAPAARFLQRVVQLIERPHLLIV